MKCTECLQPMRWNNDEELDESTWYSFYTCDKCNIDLWKYFSIDNEVNTDELRID